MATSPSDPASMFPLGTGKWSLWPQVLCDCGYEHHYKSTCPCIKSACDCD